MVNIFSLDQVEVESRNKSGLIVVWNKIDVRFYIGGILITVLRAFKIMFPLKGFSRAIIIEMNGLLLNDEKSWFKNEEEKKLKQTND